MKRSVSAFENRKDTPELTKVLIQTWYTHEEGWGQPRFIVIAIDLPAAALPINGEIAGGPWDGYAIIRAVGEVDIDKYDVKGVMAKFWRQRDNAKPVSP